MKFEVLKASLAGRICAVYLITGADGYLRDLARDIIIERVQPDRCDLDVDILQGEVIGFSEIIAKSSTYPLLSEKRVIVVSGLSATKPTAEFIEYLKKPNDSAVLIFSNDKKPDFLVGQERYFENVECNNVSASLIKKWIASKFGKRGITVEELACERIMAYTLCNFSRLDGEVEKLSAYALDKGKVQVSDVEALVAKSFDYEIYNLIDLICAKDRDRVYKALNNVLEKKEVPQKIIVALYTHFRQMFFCRINKLDAYEMTKQFRLFEYKAKLIQKQAEKFAVSELAKIMKMISEIDYKIKSGKLDGGLAAEYIITKLVA